MIIPGFNFSCNGRITCVRAKVKFKNNSQKFPCFQVWRQSSTDSSIYSKTGEVNMSSTDQVTSDILNIKLNDNNAIGFQSRDIVGFYHPPNSQYLVTYIKNTTNKYLLYQFDQNSPEVNTSRAKKSWVQPLLQLTIGMAYNYLINYCMLLTYNSKCIVIFIYLYNSFNLAKVVMLHDI